MKNSVALMAHPSISIIVPVYNAEKYLLKCIDSILSQTYADFELILINDGSKDGSGEICEEFAVKDGRITVIHKQNGGASSARNAGIDASGGEFILFIDADDWVERAFLSSFMEDQASAGCEVLILHDVQKEGLRAHQRACSFPNKTYGCGDLSQLFSETDLAWCGFPYSKLFLARIIKERGIRFDPEVHYGEDLLFLLEYLKYAEGVQTRSTAQYHYANVNEASLVKSYNSFDSEYRCFVKAQSLVKDLTAAHGLRGGGQENLRVRLGQLLGRALDSLYRPKYRKCRKERIQILKKLASTEHAGHFMRYVSSNRSGISARSLKSVLSRLLLSGKGLHLCDTCLSMLFVLRYRFETAWKVVREYSR